LVLSFGVFALFGFGEQEAHQTEPQKDEIEKDCEIPAFAKEIGHEDLWLKHNGCPPRKAKEEVETSSKL
jgi:hypothetical protein